MDNKVTTFRELDPSRGDKTLTLGITSTIVWENPNPSGSTYYHEYSTKKSAISTADLMGHQYVLKLVFESSSFGTDVVRYLATDGRSYDESLELR